MTTLPIVLPLIVAVQALPPSSPAEDASEVHADYEHVVINGASDLMVEVFGDAGQHARFAVGAPSLPLGVAVEVDGIYELAT